MRSLEEIENDYWGDAPADATTLVTTVHALRRRPVDELTVENLRMLIGQRVSLPVLLPLAVAELERDPLAEGHFYEGDLLVQVLRAAKPFPGFTDRLLAVVAAIEPDRVSEQLRREITAFRGDTH